MPEVFDVDTAQKGQADERSKRRTEGPLRNLLPHEGLLLLFFLGRLRFRRTGEEKLGWMISQGDGEVVEGLGSPPEALQKGG